MRAAWILGSRRKVGHGDSVSSAPGSPLGGHPTKLDYQDRLRLWSARPSRPMRYGIGARLADTYHGWRDGRQGIPRLQIEDPAPGPDLGGEADVGRLSTPAPEPVETPWTLTLCRRGDVQIDEEWIVHQRESALLFSWFASSITRLATLGRIFGLAADRLDEAATPDPVAFTARRMAERDWSARPSGLVRARRQNDHDRHMRRTEAAFLQVQERFSLAFVDTVVLGDLLERRRAVTRIRVRRIHDHTGRRVGAYWRKLVRVHPHGAHLNARLVPLGPNLPRWARDGSDRDRLDVQRVGP
jgi:ABC transport system ATP-binding/permease protein